MTERAPAAEDNRIAACLRKDLRSRSAECETPLLTETKQRLQACQKAGGCFFFVLPEKADTADLLLLTKNYEINARAGAPLPAGSRFSGCRSWLQRENGVNRTFLHRVRFPAAKREPHTALLFLPLHGQNRFCTYGIWTFFP